MNELTKLKTSLDLTDYSVMWSATFLPHMNHVSVTLTLLMELGPQKDREKLWPGWELNPRPSG